MSLYEELKRRKVFKTVGVYAGIAFVFMQLAADLFPYLYLPDWTVTFVIIIAILGFPITFFLSWTYDIKRDQIDTNDSSLNVKWYFTRKVFLPISGFVLMVVGALFWFIYPFISLSIADERNYDSSIAVLYMDNISSNEQSYFSDGLTIELINRLSQIQNLKVTPRIDVAFYKQNPSTINQISKDLNVDFIIDGSVKIFNNSLRVNIALFDVLKNETIWNDVYNKELNDILQVQDEIATMVIKKLNDNLNITKTDLLATGRKATDNLEAYNLIQKSYQYFKEPLTLVRLGEVVAPLAEKAIKLDPTYSDAYAMAALGLRFKWWLHKRPSGVEFVEEEVNDKKKAEEYIEKAIEYNSKNRLAKAMNVLMPQWNVKDISRANQLFSARSTMIDAKMLIQEFPNDLFCQAMYVYFSNAMSAILGAEEEDYRQQLSDLIKVYDKLEKIDFKYNEVTEIMASLIALEHIPKLYAQVNEPDNMVAFIKDNKNNFCQDGTFNCLNTFHLKMISEGYYTGYEYDEALALINSIISKSEDELLALGFNLGDQKRSYYKYGMINMKLGNNDLAIKGFDSALNLSLKDARVMCEPCEFNFSEREEEERSFEWWHGHYYRRLGLIHMLEENYLEASKYYKQAIEINAELQESNESLMKAICSYGYVQGLVGNSDVSVEKINECVEWVEESYHLIDGGYDAYETVWPLFLHYNNLNDQEKAYKYLSFAYANIDGDKIKEYDGLSESEKKNPKFFYSRDIIETYRKSLVQ